MKINCIFKFKKKHKMKIKLSLALIFSIAFTLPLAASAEDDSSTTYFSAGLMDITDKGLDFLKGTGVTIDDSSMVSVLSAGYKLSPNVALEGSIITGGESSASLSGGESGTFYGTAYSVSGSLKVKAKTDTSYLLGLKFLGGSKGPLSFNIKGGQLFWDVDYIADIKGTLTYGGTTYSVNESLKLLTVDGSDPYIGFGASYAINNNSTIELDYFSSEINDSDISGFSLAWTRNF
jgi:hypothetical protein